MGADGSKGGSRKDNVPKRAMFDDENILQSLYPNNSR
jgi:hypothetical protein